jgi:hypothetical protein
LVIPSFFLFISIVVILFISMLLTIPSLALGAPNANLLYTETNLGGGFWQYDYIFYNTSTLESLYSVYFYFTQDTSFTGTSLPTGWSGIVWDGNTWTTNFADTYSTGTSYDINAGNSLSGYSFTVDYQAGDISYDAFFSGDNVVSGTTAVTPEPISSTLFIVGGVTEPLPIVKTKNRAV